MGPLQTAWRLVT